jgi:hypothetical protein
MYGRPPYDVGYPPHDAAVSQYGQSAGSSSNSVNKSQSPSQPPQGDTARAPLMPVTSTQTPSESLRQENRNVEYNTYDPARRSYPEPLPASVTPSSANPSSTPTSQASSSYSGMPVIPTATRSSVSLPPLSYMASSSVGNSIPAYHPTTSTSSLHTSTSSSQQLKSSPRLKSPPRTQSSQPSYEHSQPYSQSASNLQNRGPYGNGSNSNKNNGVNSNLGSGNEKTTLSTSPRAASFEGYPLRRQSDDVEGERNVNESVGGEKF